MFHVPVPDTPATLDEPRYFSVEPPNSPSVNKELTEDEITQVNQRIAKHIDVPIILSSQCTSDATLACDPDEIAKLRSKISKIFMDYLDTGSNGSVLGYMRYHLTNEHVYGDMIRYFFPNTPIDVNRFIENIKVACGTKRWVLLAIPNEDCETVKVDDVSPRNEMCDDLLDERVKNFRMSGMTLYITGRNLDYQFNLFVCITENVITFNVSTPHEYSMAKSIVMMYQNNGTLFPDNGCLSFLNLSDVKHTTVEYAVYSQGYGFSSRSLRVNDIDCNVASNYNDDFDINKLYEFVRSKTSGLAIIHGKPGTGKTTLLRKMITDNRFGTNFILMDKNMFDNITDRDFMMYLIDHQGAVVIFEDCEAMLIKREEGNSRIDTILNLSDGILGDMLNLKIICTFNAEMINIDEALLRKGRLKYIYEMKPLEHEKAVALATQIGVDPERLPSGPVSLAEIYNLNIDNNNKPKEKKMMGFARN